MALASRFTVTGAKHHCGLKCRAFRISLKPHLLVARQWKTRRFFLMVTLSDGVESSWAGHRHW